MAVKIPNVKLSDGNEIPIVGFGTLEISSNPEEVREVVENAIDCGYRHLDCAARYLNEVEVGRAIRNKIQSGTLTRSELYITSKVWNSFHSRQKVVECCQNSLRDLGLDYLDLYLIHWPYSYKEDQGLVPVNDKGEILIDRIDYVETWKGMEDCLEKGLVRSIGLCNFNSKQIQRVLENCDVKPVMLQVECHPYLNQNKLLEYCRKRSIALTAYSPLGRPGLVSSDVPVLLEDNRVKELAYKHNVTPAQILLKYNVQRGIVVIPKSSKKERMKENMQLFHFELSEEDMDLLNNSGKTFRYLDSKKMKHHPDYPFNVEF